MIPAVLGVGALGGSALIWGAGRLLLSRHTITQWSDIAQADVDAGDAVLNERRAAAGRRKESVGA